MLISHVWTKRNTIVVGCEFIGLILFIFVGAAAATGIIYYNFNLKSVLLLLHL